MTIVINLLKGILRPNYKHCWIEPKSYIKSLLFEKTVRKLFLNMFLICISTSPPS